MQSISSGRLSIYALALLSMVVPVNLPGQNTTAQLTDFSPAVASATLTVQPGNIRFGTMSCSNFKSPATASVAGMSGGTGIAKLYVSSACALVLQYPASLAIKWAIAGMTAQPVAIPTVPSDAWYVAEVKIGPSAITALTDKRAIAGVDATKAGSGIIEDCTLGPCLISTDPGVVPTLGGVNAYTGTQDASAATITKPSRTVPSDPSGTCSNPSEIVLSSASGNLFSCHAGKWHATGGASGSGNARAASNLAQVDAVSYVAPKAKLDGLAVYPNNAAALAGGLTPGDFYRTGGDPDLIAVVH